MGARFILYQFHSYITRKDNDRNTLFADCMLHCDMQYPWHLAC